MPWLDDNELLGKPYELPEYRTHTQGVDIEAMVYLEVDVNPAYALLEAQWAAEQARATDPRIQGIVAHAPVEDGECVRSYLDALVKLGPAIKGVRRLIQGEADADFSSRPGFIRGAQILAEYGLSFDICIRHTQLPSAIKLVSQCPNTAFILDHIAKPNIAAHELDPWREHIRELASYPNVVCKVSGLVTEADPQHWTPEDLTPYVQHVLNVFGEDRVLFGGDWPVVLLASSYKRWVETLDNLTAHLSTEAKRKLWAENARRFYRLSTL
jgi:L-fuconolactonase